MSRCPSSRDSRLRQVLGAASSRERSYQGVAITRSVHDNHFCAVNPCFVAVVTECAGGGSFLVLPIHQTGRVDPQHPRVCGHQGRVLDVKWNPFDDHCVASCSEDCTVRLWDIPAGGVRRSLTQARKTLAGHSRRVGLIEWHPTAENLLLSSAYDYKVRGRLGRTQNQAVNGCRLVPSGAPLGRVPRRRRPPASHQGASEARVPAPPGRGAAAVRLLQRRRQQAGAHLQGQTGSGPGPSEREDPPGVPRGPAPAARSAGANVAAADAGVALPIPPGQQGSVRRRPEAAPVHWEFSLEPAAGGPLGPRGPVGTGAPGGPGPELRRGSVPLLRPGHTPAVPEGEGRRERPLLPAEPLQTAHALPERVPVAAAPPGPRGDAQARPGRVPLRGLQVLPPDRRRRSGAAAVHAGSTETGWRLPRRPVPADGWRPGGRDGGGVAAGRGQRPRPRVPEARHGPAFATTPR
ncbi:unnamed protein product [Tetraodon nigroviridis]|uniref:Coronin n=1 Tax=Tetraodon nigroviridis TaxID=99883 RepID=Q4SZE5_TETNG|nr:unnamed protein product [Tetraodon nigroviridis]